MVKINWAGQSESVQISKLKSGKGLEFGRADFINIILTTNEKVHVDSFVSNRSITGFLGDLESFSKQGGDKYVDDRFLFQHLNWAGADQELNCPHPYLKKVKIIKSPLQILKITLHIQIFINFFENQPKILYFFEIIPRN